MIQSQVVWFNFGHLKAAKSSTTDVQKKKSFWNFFYNTYVRLKRIINDHIIYNLLSFYNISKQN